MASHLLLNLLPASCGKLRRQQPTSIRHSFLLSDGCVCQALLVYDLLLVDCAAIAACINMC